MDVKILSIDDIGLSVRSMNALHRAGVNTVGDMLGYTEESLSEVRNLGKKSVDEILRKIDAYRQIDACVGLTDESADPDDPVDPGSLPLDQLLHVPYYHDAILHYVRNNDIKTELMGLSNRPKNRLLENEFRNLSDFVLLTESELYGMPAMGAGSVKEVLSKIRDYLDRHETRLRAYISGDDNALWDDEAIRKIILDLYRDLGFSGLSLREMTDRLEIPEEITEDRLKRVIGKLLANNELEYVDYRCYRVYDKFGDVLAADTEISDRSREIISRRLEGQTLEEIAQDHGITKERVRQILKRDIEKVRNAHAARTGIIIFDEDYYRYLYETYAFEKRDGTEWLGIPSYVWNYLELCDVKQGGKDLNAALEDIHGLDLGIRLKIKNYLNRNKLFIDGIWVDRKRADLEEAVARKFCRDEVSFDEFTHIYNDFLEQEEIPFSEDFYITDTTYRTRKDHLRDKRFVLWKQNERMRYYDIDGSDYTELFETLNLESYENIDLSTMKFVWDYPEILRKYDIRDQYELHNLLRKVLPEGSYNNFRCGRTPMIKFGDFDRDAAIMDLLIDNAPISSNDLAELISEEYGYEPAVIIANYLQSIAAYYHQGIYTIDQKEMSTDNMERLRTVLTEDFYYIDEIRRIYRRVVQGADVEEINPYNLKNMGFKVNSRYVIQNHASMEELCNEILTGEDIVDLAPYRKRFTYVQVFSQKLMEMKRNLQIIEFEPNLAISFRKLEQTGITREDIRNYCDAVFDFTKDGEYFSARSLRKAGFESELYDLGFSDWFYANLLISDDRFSFSNMYNNLVLFKGRKNITIKSFVTDCIRKYGSIDVYDLMNELTDNYGCHIDDKWDITAKTQGTEIYYDNILDRLYSDKDLYYNELEGGF